MRLYFKCFSFSRFLMGIIFKEEWDLRQEQRGKIKKSNILGSWEQSELILHNWCSFTHSLRNALLLSC